MDEKRYAIVNVESECSEHGYTKKQLIKEVAQVIKSEYNAMLKVDAPLAVILDIITEHPRELAKKIIEHLGVK